LINGEQKTACDMAKDLHFDSIEKILKYNPKRHAVHEAVRWGKYNAVIALFKQGVDVNKLYEPSDYETPTTAAAAAAAAPGTSAERAHSGMSSVSSQSSSIANFVLGPSRSASSQSSVSSSSSTAAPSSSAAAVAKSNRRKSDPTAGANEPAMVLDGMSPLMVAAACNHTSIVGLLLKCPDLKMNLRDTNRGWTAVTYAASKGSEDALIMLLKAGASRYNQVWY
jgi:hypothetical protein